MAITHFPVKNISEEKINKILEKKYALNGEIKSFIMSFPSLTCDQEMIMQIMQYSLKHIQKQVLAIHAVAFPNNIIKELSFSFTLKECDDETHGQWIANYKFE